jgi:hypothetical protein
VGEAFTQSTLAILSPLGWSMGCKVNWQVLGAVLIDYLGSDAR